MGEVFALWFSDPQSIRVFLHAAKNAFESASSRSVYFPLGQWANLQIYIDRVNGYDMRVYDLARREVARASEKIYLYD
jgi:hypothetical protein